MRPTPPNLTHQTTTTITTASAGLPPHLGRLAAADVRADGTAGAAPQGHFVAERQPLDSPPLAGGRRRRGGGGGGGAGGKGVRQGACMGSIDGASRMDVIGKGAEARKERNVSVTTTVSSLLCLCFWCGCPDGPRVNQSFRGSGKIFSAMFRFENFFHDVTSHFLSSSSSVPLGIACRFCAFISYE